jgi:hypothetical protein
LLPFSVLGQQNICIDSINEPEEVSIAMSQKNPGIMIAGANITCNYYSTDTGRTWKGGYMKSSYGVWGDPIVLSDTGTNFYFFHLSTPPDGHWIDRMVCQKSADSGKTFNNGSFTGLNGERNQDKPGCAVDYTHSPYRNHTYIAWTQFDHYESTKPADSSRILFSYSEDGTTTWSNPIRIDSHGGDCLDGDSTDEGAVPAVGPNGEIYVAWGGPEGLAFNKSFDGGKTWMPRQKKIASIIGGWDYDVPGINRCDGLPVTACDISNGPNRGTIYVNWSDQRNGTDNTDIWLVKSADKGETWSRPIRINNDTGTHHQFMSWFSVDPANGYLYCLFYDRRNHEGDTTDVYLAVSRDGGDSFMNFRINDKSFVPTAMDFFGDYISVQALNNIVRPIWMQMNNHRLRIFTALLNGDDLNWSMYTASSGARAKQAYPEYGKENESLWIQFKLMEDQEVSLSVVDVWGKTIYTVWKNKPMREGRKEYILDLAHKHIPDGAYAYKLETKTGTVYQPLVIY